MALKTYKELYSEGIEYGNSEDVMFCEYSYHLQKYIIVFNSKLIEAKKTYNEFNKKRVEMINKYSLIKINKK